MKKPKKKSGKQPSGTSFKVSPGGGGGQIGKVGFGYKVGGGIGSPREPGVVRGVAETAAKQQTTPVGPGAMVPDPRPNPKRGK